MVKILGKLKYELLLQGRQKENNHKETKLQQSYKHPAKI